MRVAINTQLGEYVGFISDKGVHRLFFPNSTAQVEEFTKTLNYNDDTKHCEEIASLLRAELTAYHEKTLKEFTCPLDLQATHASPFRLKVWETMRQIPYGSTWTYGELAKAVGSTSGRAIGGACSGNPVPLLVPCHRVIATNGTLGGYSGGKFMKQVLLDLEKSNCEVPLANVVH